MHRINPEHGPWVALVGAGPGDPDLLTRRAAMLLEHADVVLHDWLAGRDVLALTRPDARLIDVGKGKGCGASQRYIERLLVAHHAAGCRVVRLKGGDPFVFGRGMEEVDAARAAGIDVEVVPGITSALAGPALAGIAVTERGVSAHVTVLTGHRVDGDNDWRALAAVGGTLVVLMAATTGARVAAALVEGGMDAATPAAAVTEVSGRDQEVRTFTLGGLAARGVPLPGPCVVVIGAVAARASDELVALAWERSASRS